MHCAVGPQAFLIPWSAAGHRLRREAIYPSLSLSLLRPPAPWIVAALHGLRVDRAHVGGSGEGGEEREEAGFTRYRAARRGGFGGGKEGGE